MARGARAGAVLLLVFGDPAGAQTQVSNTAALTYRGDNGPVALSSNTVTLTVAPPGASVADTMLLDMTASVREAAMGEPIVYRLRLTNRGTAAASPVLHGVLPQGLHYVAGSVRGAVAADEGASLDLALPMLAPGASVEVRYTATLAPGAATGDVLNRAVAMIGGAPASNEAFAAVRLRAPFFTDAMTVLGQIETGICGGPEAERRGVAGVRVLLENGMFALSDRNGMFHLEGLKPGRHAVQIDLASLGGRYAPILCSDDTRAAGSSSSRFVEGAGGAVQRVDFRLRETGVAAPPVATSTAPDTASAAGERDWLRETPPGTAILFPAADYNPRAPVTRVVVAHAPGQRVALRLNDAPVDPLTFDATERDATRGVAVSRWSGLPLLPGENHIVARILAPDGTLVQQVERVVTLSGTPARAIFDPAHSRLIADGRTPPLIAVRVVDGAGRPVRDGTLLRFAVDPPYAAAGDAELDQRRAAAGQVRDTSARVTGDDGIALIALAPTTRAGAVHLTIAPSPEKNAHPSDIRTWLEAGVQDWVVVGFAEGTVGHDLLAQHREADANGRVAFYAKGRIKGSWLLTLAYDSDRLRDRSAASRGEIDPNRYYTVYGDAAQQGEDASGGGTLYVRLERRDAYILFGDMETGLGDTQLLRYLRNLDGVKAAYEGKLVRASGFVARASSAHVRDEIRGGGITGPYRLSARRIVPDSDVLAIEIRDRLRSEKIVSRRTLTRHIDYEIDAEQGSIRFRDPLPSRDLDQNALFVIAEYESDGGATGEAVAGGRVSVVAGRIELGASVLRDEGLADATVVGGDVKIRIDTATVVRAEVANGGRGGLAAGTAYLAEVEHHGTSLDVLAYVRQQDAGFGVGQQNAVEAGTRKIGIDARAVLAPRTVLTTSAWTQKLLDGSATRSSGEIRIERATDGGSLFVGGQIAVEQRAAEDTRVARLLKLGGSRVLAGGALVVSGEAQIGSGDGGTVFPVRQRIAAEYRLIPAVRVIAAYERTSGDVPRETAQAGLDVTPWAGASLTTMLNRSTSSEDSARVFAVYGIDQRVPLGERWSVNATVDGGATLHGAVAKAQAPDPFGAGTAEDFTAVTIGATNRAAHWSWTGRMEYRGSAAATRFGLTMGALRALGDGQTLAASVHAYRSTAPDGSVSDSATADLALALRPRRSRWSVLDRMEVRYSRGDIALGSPDVPTTPDGPGTEAVNNLAIDYRAAPDGGHGFEASFYYGAKYSGGDTGSFVDVTGLALRHDLASWLDIGVQASVQHGWTTETVLYSAGPSLGVSPARGVWISGGYNLYGFHDAAFSGGNYTRGGPFLTLRTKFDQNSLGLVRK